LIAGLEVQRMSSQRGFTLVELGAVCVAGSIGAALVLAGTGARSAAPSANQPGPRTGERAVQPETKPVLPQGPSGAGSQNATTERERALAWQQKDAAQVRELHAALVIWGNQHNDEFPLPSKFDVKQTTVLGPRRPRTRPRTSSQS
jgi:hypothetical protein